MSRLLTISRYRVIRGRLGYHFSTHKQQQQSNGFLARFRWVGIPVTLGVTCIGFLHLRRVLWRERDNPASPHPMTWQLVAFLQIPSRTLSRLWGALMDKEIHPYFRAPLLGLYRIVFKCDMTEVERKELSGYTSFGDFFTRDLIKGIRPINQDHQLVSPVDGRILHFGPIDKNHIEQVKGVKYSLNAFLGPGLIDSKDDDADIDNKNTSDTSLYHIVLYLSPGDCHHFHSPADWKTSLSRHLPGELLTVAPWAARTMPGLFALNERVILNGSWEHGVFIFAAVGAYNVGSIAMDVDQELKTNMKGKYLYGSYFDKMLKSQNGEDSIELAKGDHIGIFKMGSSIVIIFEAPKTFEFVTKRNQKIKIGQPIGKVTKK